MAPGITVFVYHNKTLTNAHTIKTLEKYYPPFVDGKNLAPVDMKFKYNGCNGKFFSCDTSEWIMYDLEVVDLIPPSFLVSFDIGTKVSKESWNLILKWVRTIFDGQEDYELNRQIEALIPKYVNCPEKITLSKQIEPKTVLDKKDYDFKYEIDCDFDRCLLEVEKPYTDKPYTVVIREFSKKGFLPFFTALYVCTSWGVCNLDHLFLERLWTHMNMQAEHGPLDLENRLKAEIAKCLPTEGACPNAEPEVYRLDIMGVKELFAGKQKRIDEMDIDR